MVAVTFADLWYRARQFLIAVIGVGLVLAVALAVTGLADGFHAEIQNFVNQSGASTWVMAKSAEGRLTPFAAFPASEVSAVARQPGVHEASPIVFAASQVVHANGSTAPVTVNLVGVAPGGLGAPHVVSGHGITGPGQAVVDSKVSTQLGSRITVTGGHDFTVVGVVHGATMTGGIPLVYMPVSAVDQVVTGGRPLITAIAVRGTPAHVPAGLVVLAPSTVISDTMGQLKSAVSSIDNTRWLMWIIAAVIVAAMLYVAALERKRDFAVLKALGSSSRTLFLSLVLEAVVVTLLAALLAELVASLLTPTFAQPVDITMDARLALPLVAIVVGAVASVAALRRVTGADPAAAFS
jgi:putative ABC transport system permease protein